MAIAYKSKVFSNSAANTSQALFTAVASNTLVKSIICNNDGKSTGTATLRINESGGSSKLIRRVTIASGDTSVELLYDVLALEAGDILYVTSTDTDITFIMSYAEDSESLVLQSIDVLSDVNTTGKVDGDVLTWDDTTSKWVALAPTGDGGATTLDGLTDVTITTAIDHDALVYDEASTTWVNGAPKSLDMPVYNGTGAIIAKGVLLKAVGAHGDKVSVGLFAIGVDSPKYLVGISADTLAIGGTGHARVYGEIRGIDTNAYSIGTILYASATPGAFTTTAPFPEIPVAIVTRQQQNTGRLVVRTWVPGGGGAGTTTNPTTLSITNAGYPATGFPGKIKYLLFPPQGLWTISQGTLTASVNTAVTPNRITIAGSLAGRVFSGDFTINYTAVGTGVLLIQVIDIQALNVVVAQSNARYELGSNTAKLSFTHTTTAASANFAIQITPSPQMVGNVIVSYAQITV